MASFGFLSASGEKFMVPHSKWYGKSFNGSYKYHRLFLGGGQTGQIGCSARPANEPKNWG